MRNLKIKECKMSCMLMDFIEMVLSCMVILKKSQYLS